MFSFKRADVSEIADVQRIAADTWPSVYYPIVGKEQVAYMLKLIYSNEALQRQFAEGQYFYFIYQDDELAGFASFAKLQDDIWKLHKIYVLPSSQGTGAGRSLLDFCIKKVISLGASQLVLNVNRANDALFFYQKMGFKITDVADIDIGNGYFMNDYVMMLPLQDEE